MAGRLSKLLSWTQQKKSSLRQKLSLSRNQKHRFNQFFAHFISFLPSLGIAGMAMMMGVVPKSIVVFLVFTFATISLEVCFTCLRAKYNRISRIQDRMRPENDPEARYLLYELLDEASVQRGQCWLYVGVVGISWLLVAVFEVAHMGLLPAAAFAEKAAQLCAGLNFAIAIRKMWVHAGEVVSHSSSIDEELAMIRLKRDVRPEAVAAGGKSAEPEPVDMEEGEGNQRVVPR